MLLHRLPCTQSLSFVQNAPYRQIGLVDLTPIEGTAVGLGGENTVGELGCNVTGPCVLPTLTVEGPADEGITVAFETVGLRVVGTADRSAVGFFEGVPVGVREVGCNFPLEEIDGD
jgi:hypothetical protein